MTTKKMTVPERQDSGRDVKQLFAFMHAAAWITLAVGILLSLWNVGHFSDQNLPLMLGIGFMVGSVFIYTIGTAIHLVHQRK